jgi:hypothetical protein
MTKAEGSLRPRKLAEGKEPLGSEEKGLMGEVAALFLPLCWMLVLCGVFPCAPGTAAIRAPQKRHFHSYFKRLFSPSSINPAITVRWWVAKQEQTAGDRSVGKDAPKKTSSRVWQGGRSSFYEGPSATVAYFSHSISFDGPRSTYLELDYVRSPPGI